MVMLTYNASPLESEAGRRIASVLKAARGLCSKYRASPGFISRTQPFQEAKREKKGKRKNGRKEGKRRKEVPLPLFHLLNCQLPARCVAQSHWVVCLSGVHKTVGSVPSMVQNSIGCLIRRHCRR